MFHIYDQGRDSYIKSLYSYTFEGDPKLLDTLLADGIGAVKQGYAPHCCYVLVPRKHNYAALQWVGNNLLKNLQLVNENIIRDSINTLGIEYVIEAMESTTDGKLLLARKHGKDVSRTINDLKSLKDWLTIYLNLDMVPEWACTKEAFMYLSKFGINIQSLLEDDQLDDDVIRKCVYHFHCYPYITDGERVRIPDDVVQHLLDTGYMQSLLNDKQVDPKEVTRDHVRRWFRRTKDIYGLLCMVDGLSMVIDKGLLVEMAGECYQVAGMLNTQRGCHQSVLFDEMIEDTSFVDGLKLAGMRSLVETLM